MPTYYSRSPRRRRSTARTTRKRSAYTAQRRPVRTRRGRRAQQNNTRWSTWLCIGAFLLFMVVGAIYKQKDVLFPSKASVKTSEKIKQSSQISERKTKVKKISKKNIHKTQPRFDFYTVLSNEDEHAKAADDQRQQQSKTSKENLTKKSQQQISEKYLLQIASFRNYSDADRLKAQLILQGFEVNIKYFESKNSRQKNFSQKNSGWYRVAIGPFLSRETAEEVQRQLSTARLDSLLLRQG